MSVAVISRNQMLRDMLASACESGGFSPTKSYEVINDVSWLLPNDILLVHASRDCVNVGNKVSQFRRRNPGVKIIILAASAIVGHLSDELRGMVEAVVSDDRPAKTLLSILTVVNDGFRVDSGVAPATAMGTSRVMSTAEETVEDAVNGVSKLSRDAELHRTKLAESRVELAEPLSARETTIMAKLRQGSSNKDIANELGICEGTVKVHLRTCYRKIGVRNRTQAAIWAEQNL